MGFIAVIAALFYLFGLPAAVVFLLVSNARLGARIALLEQAAAPAPRQAPRAPGAQLPAPAAASPSAQPPIPAPPADPRPSPVPRRRARADLLIAWLAQNWFYAVSAASLALAGIFLVQYGAERGLLPPPLRVLAALAFGGALVAAGEWIRRRHGDEGGAAAYLPSTFSGAGIVTLFAAVLAARMLYDMIGPETAMIAMAMIGAGAMVTGWFYGPLLAAIGVIGATAAPFVVGGASRDPSWLLAYFAVVAMTGLAIDTMRRWGWVSALSLTLGLGAGFALTLGAGVTTGPWFMMQAAALALAAIAIPARRLRPDHQGAPCTAVFLPRRTGDARPAFPTLLAGGAALAASGLIVVIMLRPGGADIFWTGVIVLTALALALLVWTRDAPALGDLALAPAAALLAAPLAGMATWRIAAQAAQAPGAGMPSAPAILVGVGMAVSAAAAWRSLRGGPLQVHLAAGAALFAPSLAIGLEVLWRPAGALGAPVWAIHAMAIAALMVLMAERFARADGPEHRLRMSLAALSALACAAFGGVILFTSAALTVALAATVVAAAWLDRRFDLPAMGLHIVAGIAAVGYRLVLDPGLSWAETAPLPEVLLSHGGAVPAFAAAWALVRGARAQSAVMLESAAVSAFGILVSVLIFRAILGWGGRDAVLSHWSLGIGATVWIMLALAQLRRLDLGGPLAGLRLAMGAGFGLLGAAQLALAVTLGNPALQASGPYVLGPAVLNTLIPAYLLPAAALWFGARWLATLHPRLRMGFHAAAAALAALWLALAIRHVWRGPIAMGLPGIDQPELYSYTVALLLIGGALFYLSLARRSALLRKIGLAVIGLAAAKVFLADIAGLGGLMRVFSLLFLGLSLAALAWLNRWAQGQVRARDDTAG